MILGMFSLLVITMAIGIPIGIVLLLASALPGILNSAFPVDLEFTIRNIVTGFDNTSLLAIPLFMMSGIIMARGQISKLLFDVFTYIVGKRTGGLPSAVVVTCLFYGAISGSGPATTAAVGAMTIPMLTSLGYDLGFCAALVAVAGGLGVIIPPSIPFIMYANSSGVSVGDMFIGGILPGICIAALLIIYVYFYCKKFGEDIEKINNAVNNLRKDGFFYVIKKSSFALLTPVIILGGIYSGLVTPTEAALISVIYALIISLFIYKTIKIKDIIPILNESARTLVPCMIIIGAASAFAKVIAILRVPQAVALLLGDLISEQVILLLIINAILIVVGMLIDTGAAILIMTPILLPITNAAGIDPLHFGIFMTVNLAIGFVTPPVGMNLYVAASMTSLPAAKISKCAIPFLIVFGVALMFITYIPEISLFLVNIGK